MFGRRSLVLLSFKRLAPSHPSQTKPLFNPALNFLSAPSFKAFFCNRTIPSYPFSSSFKNLQRTDLQEDMNLLLSTAFSREELTNTTEILEKYSECKDFSLLTENEIQWISWVLYNLSQAQMERNNYDRAYRYLAEHEDLYKKIGIKDNFDLAQNYYYRAYIYLEQNNLSDADRYLNEVSRICQLLEEDNQDVKGLKVQYTCSLASLSVKSGQDQDKALVLYNSVLKNQSDLREGVLPTVLMEVHQGMGWIFSLRNDIEKAMDSWTKGLEIAVKHFGENSKDTYVFYALMADFLSQRGEYLKAQQYGEKGVQAALKVFSKDSFEVATGYTTLGKIYQKTRDSTKALNSFKKAAKIFETSPEYYSNVLCEAYFQMALTYVLQGNSQEASDFLAKADQALVLPSERSQFQLGEKYFKWAQDIQDLGNMMEESKAYYWKALEAYQRCEPVNKSGILGVYANLGLISYGEKDWNRACELLKEYEMRLDEDITNPSLTQTLYRYLGSASIWSGNYDEGEKYLQKALHGYQATGDRKWIGEIYHNLGIIYERKVMLKEALEALQKAVEHGKQRTERNDSIIEADLEKIAEIKEKLKLKSEESSGKISQLLKTFKNSDKKNSS